VEFDLRKNDRVKGFLGPGRRKLPKRDLQRLPSEYPFACVREHYTRR
jgi:hypothetical protein